MIENNVIEDNTLVKGSKVFVEERDIEEFTGRPKKERVPWDRVIALANGLRPSEVTTAMYKIHSREKIKGLHLWCWTRESKVWMHENPNASACAFSIRAKQRDGDDFCSITEVPDFFFIINAIMYI